MEDGHGFEQGGEGDHVPIVGEVAGDFGPLEPNPLAFGVPDKLAAGAKGEGSEGGLTGAVLGVGALEAGGAVAGERDGLKADPVIVGLYA